MLKIAALVVPLLAVPTALGPAAADAPPTCRGRVATIVGTSGADRLTGTPGDDVIVAGGGNDTVRAGSGNDLVCGGFGLDDLLGQRGRDRLFGGPDFFSTSDEGTERIGDRLRGGPGNDLLAPGLDRRTADEVHRDLLAWGSATGPMRIDLRLGTASGGGQGHDRISGRGFRVLASAFGDDIRGSRTADEIKAGGGPDLVRGGRGDDLLLPDPFSGGAADRVWGGPGADDLEAFGGADVLRGGPGPDTVVDTGDSADRLFGGPGDDRLVDQLWTTDAASQVVSGGRGSSDSLLLNTSALNPALGPGRGAADLREGLVSYAIGTTEVTGGLVGLEDLDLASDGSAWTVRGTGAANDVSATGSAGTRFFGRGGDDVFTGSAQADLFDGGRGTDRARSLGDGDDSCVDVEIFDVAADQVDCATP